MISNSYGALNGAGLLRTATLRRDTVAISLKVAGVVEVDGYANMSVTVQACLLLVMLLQWRDELRRRGKWMWMERERRMDAVVVVVVVMGSVVLLSVVGATTANLMDCGHVRDAARFWPIPFRAT